jgi:hypothetical protein
VAFKGVLGLLDMGRGAGRAALCHHVTGTALAAATLGRHTEFELDLVEAHASTGVTGDFAVRDTAADTDDHISGSVVDGFNQAS